MSTERKQLGDRVLITAGPNKDKLGKLVEKKRGGWVVELDDGQRVSVSFPMIAVVRSVSEMENDVANETTEEQNEETLSDQESDDQSATGVAEESTTSETANPEQDITKMSVKQLQELAKQRGIGIARTKSDFLRIIQEKNPDEDLDQLVGKVLFNRVKELHISRLRNKQDLINLLSDDER